MYHFIYPSKDAYIYELNTNSEKNFGGDNNLVLKKDFDVESLNGVSRVLLQFDLTEVSNSIVSGEITNPTYYLRLYEQKTSELSPTYQLDTFPLSSSWEDGTGYTTQDPNSRNGVSWVRGDESFDNTNWSLNRNIQNSSSIRLDGSSDYVDCGDVSDVEGIDELSISCWFKLDAIGEGHGLVQKDTYGGATSAFSFDIDSNNRLEFSVKNSKYIFLFIGMR